MSSRGTVARGRAAWVLAVCAAVVFGCVGVPSAGARQAVPDPGCTVSTLLVPSCGAWLGSSIPSKNGRYDYGKGLSEYEAAAQNVPDILHFYKVNGDTFPTSDEVALTRRDGAQASLLFYNWKPSTSLSWRQIADGGADGNIRAVAASLQRYPGRLFLAIHHEPENDQGGPDSGRTPADYVAMYRHVVTMLRDSGVTNAVYVMNFMGFAGWASVADAFYPGDDVVDWIAYDPYAHAGAPTFSALLNRPDGRWPGFYQWAVDKAPGKPIMLGEWAFDLQSQPLAPEALDDAHQVLQEQFPMLKALVYWNSRTTEYDYRLDQQTDAGVAFAAAYARLANQQYFNATDVAAVDLAPTPDAPEAPVTTAQPQVTIAPTTVPAVASTVQPTVNTGRAGTPACADGQTDSLDCQRFLTATLRRSVKPPATSPALAVALLAIAAVAIGGVVLARRQRRHID
jgi:hypothetical protein